MRFDTGSMITSCSSWSGFQPAHSSLRGSAVDCALALASLAANSGDYFSRLANDAATCAHQAKNGHQQVQLVQHLSIVIVLMKLRHPTAIIAPNYET
jgi:hypothetical protein